MENTKPKVVFRPGDFDDFTGTQEELDELVRIITTKIEAGTFQEDFSDNGEDDDSEEEFTPEELEEMAQLRAEARRRSLH
jgi:hypothetical protein